MQIKTGICGILFSLCIASVSSLSAATPPTTVASAGPDQKEFGEVMELLKTRYADPVAISDNKIGNAALNGVLERLGGGATLLSQPSVSGPQRLISSELLPGNIVYWRTATFKPIKDWTQLETQLSDWQKNGAIGLVLDIRDFESTNDYAGAARMASIFTPPGEALFTVDGLQIPQQVYHSTAGIGKKLPTLPLVILTNRRTTGAAEALAAVLRQDAKAILVGRSTAGQAALFAEIKLSTGRYLRLATGQAVLADGTTLFGKPIIPDIALYIDDRNERLALEENNQGQAAALVRELPPRPHTSESALVHDQTPELDELIAEQLASHETDPKTENIPLQDIALIRAMDVLRSIQFAQTQPPVSNSLTSKK